MSRGLLLLLVCLCWCSKTSGQGLVYIDTSFENASPLHYQIQDDGVVQVYLMYDHERNSNNRAAGHWHFCVEGTPNTTLKLVLNNFYNVWNGTPGFPISDKTIVFYSADGRNWIASDTELLTGNDRIQLQVPIAANGKTFVARLPPYRLSDLDHFVQEIAAQPLVKITKIGQTVQQRSLEIIQVGPDDAPNKIFLRARAHPWEPGGNWVIEGMVRHLLNADHPVDYFERFSVYILPMANKDGVAAGRTRFNMLGRDLNRNWDVPADQELCPENYHLEQWLQGMVTTGTRFKLAIELHNDERGLLHISRPPGIDLAAYLGRMNHFESLLREKTWFREGSTQATFSNPGSLGEGWLARFGTDAIVHELNCNWIEGLQTYPSSEHWMLYGRQMCDVLYAYCD